MGDPSLVAPGVWRVEDTCAVYLIVQGREAVAIDFGAGRALEFLEGLGIDRITDVLLTHHHRDQAQGLPLAVAHGARVHVPPVEVDLVRDVDEMWRTRNLDNDYEVRQVRFSVVEAVPSAMPLREYVVVDYGGVSLRAIPTPGHTVGSVTYLLDRHGQRLAFSGDLIYAPGKVWSLAATQWSYTGHEGAAMAVLSCYLLRDEAPDLLLPSHGAPMAEAEEALSRLAANLTRYVDSRRWTDWDLLERLRRPYVPLTEHLLLNRSSLSTGYVLVSTTGEALLIDYGYDMTTGLPGGADRSARRPWLASLPALKSEFGVTRIAAALPTHYHDDHVAGMPLLRDAEGVEIWSPSTVAPVLADPWMHDLPCQWYEPIPSDRVLPVGESFSWNEYRITVHDQPGHTLFAVAYEVEVDGVVVLFTGDQQENLGIPDVRREILNYQYRNRFRLHDYEASAALYRRVAPGLMVSGHWTPRTVDDAYLTYLRLAGEDLVAMHELLLPLDELDLGADGVLARITPYRSRVGIDSELRLTAAIRNPHSDSVVAVVRTVLPPGWTTPDPEVRVALAAAEERDVPIVLRAPLEPQPRARVAIDVAIGELLLGQHAEALVDVVDSRAVDP